MTDTTDLALWVTAVAAAATAFATIVLAVVTWHVIAEAEGHRSLGSYSRGP